MSIPLVQDNNKDSINTSIIAIKRYIDRINMLLGLSNSEEIDTSVFATKDELQQAITELSPVDEVTLNNMQSVTSNAVAESLSYSTSEVATGGKWIDGKPIYRIAFKKVIADIGNMTDVVLTNILADKNIDTLVTLRGSVYFVGNSVKTPMPNKAIQLVYVESNGNV